MQRLFRLIRKNRNQTRFLAAFFLICLVIEIFSHAQDNIQIFKSELLPAGSKVCISDDKETDQAAATPVYCSEQQDDNLPYDAGDQINHHHQVLTVAYDFSLPAIERCSEKILSQFESPVYNSLPPPYLPPELS
jgi:hypothetical protein